MNIKPIRYCIMDLEVFRFQLDYYQLRKRHKPTSEHPFPEKYISYKEKRSDFDVKEFYAIITNASHEPLMTFNNMDVFLDFLITDNKIYTLNFVSYNGVDLWVTLYILFHNKKYEVEDTKLNILDVFYSSIYLNPNKIWFSLSDYHKFITNNNTDIDYKRCHRAEFDTLLLLDIFKWLQSNNKNLIKPYRF